MNVNLKQAATLSAHARLTVHLDKHMYKRGFNIGDAPADKDRRAKTNFRVIKRGENIAVRLHNTDILTAYPNGDVVLDCRGWAHSSTTKAAMGFALRMFRSGQYANMGSYKFKGNSQTCLQLPNGRLVKYYDGIRLSQTSEVLTPLRAFQCTRIDRVKSKALADGVKASGFKSMFAMLYATVTADDKNGRTTGSGIKRITNADNAESWPTIVACAKFVGGYYNNTVYENDTPAKAWTRCMNMFKHMMYETVDTETTELIYGVAK